MGLFDNIFLDQDTPTAVAEPPAQTEDTSPETISVPTNIETSEVQVSPEATTLVSPDAEVSFDIGGDIDFSPSVDTGTFLSGGEVKDITPTTEITDTLSIAMIQGATNATGAMIVGDTPEQKTEPTTANIEVVSEENHPETGVESTNDAITLSEDTQSSEVADSSQALFGILDNAKDEKNDAIPVTENVTKNEEAPIDILGGEEVSLVNDITPSTLGELDTEIAAFIEKLESLRKNGTTENEYQQKLDTIAEREKALEEEIDVRKKALEYEKAEIIREQEEQKTEEAKLTRIIDSLKKETK